MKRVLLKRTELLPIHCTECRQVTRHVVVDGGVPVCPYCGKSNHQAGRCVGCGDPIDAEEQVCEDCNFQARR